MKKQILLIIMLFSLITPAISQKIDSVYWAKFNISMYSDCSAKKFIQQIPLGAKLLTRSTICTDNDYKYRMIKVKTVDEKMIGWVDLNDLLEDRDYKLDSINQSVEIAKKMKIKIFYDSLKSAHELENLKQKMLKDSLNAVMEKVIQSKPFWVIECSAYDYTSQSAGIIVSFYNNSKKTIKYVNFTAVPYNAVDDLVIDSYGKSSKTCKLVGPVTPEETATYQNDILFFSSVVSYYKLKNISVQYMDNTMQYFNYKDILLKNN